MSESAPGLSTLIVHLLPFLVLSSSILLHHQTEGGILLGSSSVSASTAKFRLCGKHLADLLSLVCRGRGFYNPGTNGFAHRENRFGVSDECCRMGCTEATLESYCAEAPPSVEAQSSPEVIGHRQHRLIPPSRMGEEVRLKGEEVQQQVKKQESKQSSSTESSSSSSSEVAKVRRGKGKREGRRRRIDGGEGRRRRLDDLDERGRRRREKGRRCRCGKRRRRKTDPETIKHQKSHQSYQIGTIPPSFLGTPVILSRINPRISS